MRQHESIVRPAVLDERGACTYLSIGRTKLFDLCRAGEIAPIRIGRAVRYPVATLDAFIARQLDA